MQLELYGGKAELIRHAVTYFERQVTGTVGRVLTLLGQVYQRLIKIYESGKKAVAEGIVYGALIRKERAGAFMGTTVQVVPHVVDEIRAAPDKPVGTPSSFPR